MAIQFNRVRRRTVRQGLAAMAGLVALPLFGPGTARAATDGRAGTSVRLALLVGNRDYVAPQDLPPITKNLRDLKAALEAKGFAVTDAINLDLQRSKEVIAAFSRTVAAAPPDATVFFYYSGHGVQDAARNLLLPVTVNPAQPDDVKKGSLVLDGDVLAPLAPRVAGATYAVIDACRVSITVAVAEKDGLNQVKAPDGCLIAFSTGAGKPALAPAEETKNTFYTGALVRALNTAADTVSFNDLFHAVRKDVRESMLAHPLRGVRALAQDPFIADNTHVTVPLALRSVVAQQPDGAPGDDAALWLELQQAAWPADIAKLAKAYLEQFPKGSRTQSVSVALDGAMESTKILKGINLYRSSFTALAERDQAGKRDALRAARGDKDAAERIAQRYRDFNDGTEMGRYVAWLKYASALGNGIAAYDLNRHFSRQDQVDEAARYFDLAKSLGYTPPPTLDPGRSGK